MVAEADGNSCECTKSIGEQVVYSYSSENQDRPIHIHASDIIDQDVHIKAACHHLERLILRIDRERERLQQEIRGEQPPITR